MIVLRERDFSCFPRNCRRLNVSHCTPVLADLVDAVYTEGHEWTNARLSGVGIRAPTADMVSKDATSRYDDLDLDPSPLRDI